MDSWKRFLAFIEGVSAQAGSLPDLAEVISCLASAHPLSGIWRRKLDPGNP